MGQPARIKYTCPTGSSNVFVAPAGCRYVTLQARRPAQILPQNGFGAQTVAAVGFPVYIDANGSAWAFGGSGVGMGCGQATAVSNPYGTQVGTGIQWAQLSYCPNSVRGYGLSTSGKIYGWGNYSSPSPIGDGGILNQSTPVILAGQSSFQRYASIWAPGGVLYAIDEQGYTWSCGNNSFGQCGVNVATTTAVSTPTLVSSLGNSVVRIYSDGSSVWFLNNAGQLYAAGFNAYGQLGINNTLNQSTPVLVVGGYTYKQLAMSTNGAVVGLTTDNRLVSWGINTAGELGLGTVNNGVSSPSIIAPGLYGTSWASIWGGNRQFFATDTSGNMWCWGGNSVGPLPINAVGGASTPTLWAGPSFTGVVNSGLNTTGNLVKVAFEGYGQIGAALSSTGQIYCWGVNAKGQLGQGNTLSYSSPVIWGGAGGAGALFYKDVSFGAINGLGAMVMAISNLGQIYVCGNQTNGELGLGSAIAATLAISSPVIMSNGLGTPSLAVPVNDVIQQQTIQVIPGQSYPVVFQSQGVAFGGITVFNNPCGWDSLEVLFSQ